MIDSYRLCVGSLPRSEMFFARTLVFSSGKKCSQLMTRLSFLSGGHYGEQWAALPELKGLTNTCCSYLRYQRV